MDTSARYESLKEAVNMSPNNKRVVKFLIFADEDELKKVLKKEDRNEFLNLAIESLPKTRQTEKWLKNGGYFKILDWGEKVAEESKFFIVLIFESTYS